MKEGGNRLHRRTHPLFLLGLGFSLWLIALGLLLSSPEEAWDGLWRIMTEQDLLITDYFALVGIGPSLVNAGLVTLVSLLIVQLSGDVYNGFTLVELSLMAGFALFGKNLFNITPLLLGTWCYARYQREPFSKYAGVGLLSTALAPLISYLAFGSVHASLPLALGAGLALGFLLPPLAAYTYKIQNGMNLYNMGFACGLLAMMIVPVLTAFGDRPEQNLLWYDAHQTELILAMDGFCLLLICLGLMATGKRRREVWADYGRLLGTTGRVPSDYLRMFGPGAVLVNAGINGLFGMAYLFLIGGQFNGPTIGGLLAIMGFSAFGKHAGNIIPVVLGVALGAYGMHATPDTPSLQLAALFGTTLAPVSGHFGWFWGTLAGFIHSCLVLQTSGPVEGMNLYNNGFSGGLIAIFLYPVATALSRRRWARLGNRNYFDIFRATGPLDPELARDGVKTPCAGDASDRSFPPQDAPGYPPAQGRPPQQDPDGPPG